MSNAYLSPLLNDAQFNDDCTFLAGGLIWFYQAGTSTPLLAYTTPVADTAWSNPIQLDQRGETGGEIWLKSGSSYKIILEGPPEYGQAHGVVISTFDNITGVNDPGTTTIQNWVAFTGTPTYISATSFSVTGDQRTTFLESRRLKTTNTAGTIYSTVVSSAYATGVTTVTVSNDYGQALDSGLSAVSYGFVETGAVSSIPIAVNAGSAASGSQYQMWIDYDGTNLKWAKNTDIASATWPINVTAAANASGATFFATATAGGEADIGAACPTVNNAYLYNKSTDWGIYSTDGGFALKYDRSTSKFSYGGFTLPTPSGVNGYFKLPNNLIIQYGSGNAAGGAGATITLPTAYSTTNYIITTGVYGTAVTTHAEVVVNPSSTTSFTAYQTNNDGFFWITVGY